MDIPDTVLSQALSLPDSVETHVEQGMTTTLQTAISIAQEHGDEDMLTTLRETMLDFVKMAIQMRQFKTAAETIRKKVQDKAITEGFSRHLKEELERVKAKEARQDPKTHEKFVDFEERLQAATGSYEPEEEAAAVQIDGDLIVTQGIQSTKCPYTQKEMENPVKNRHCGHSYDHTGIMAFIRNRGVKARCPVGGCPNKRPLVEKDLIIDKELRAFILRKNSQRAP